MGKIGKVAIVVVLGIVVTAMIFAKKSNSPVPSSPPATQAASQPATQGVAALPRLVDLGSTTCIPCRRMTPILEELKKEYVGQMQVEFIDVNENRDAARSFGIRVIPTQVFLDSAGKELWRHEGFMPKEDILAKWKELGVRFVEGPGTH